VLVANDSDQAQLRHSSDHLGSEYWDSPDALIGSRKQSPEIRRLPGLCVSDTFDNRENNCHQRLDDKPEMKRAV
jgi:hypothetical protein